MDLFSQVIEKRGQHEIEKMKEVVGPKKKKGGGVGGRKKRTEIHKYTTKDAQVKRRIEIHLRS